MLNRINRKLVAIPLVSLAAVVGAGGTALAAQGQSPASTTPQAGTVADPPTAGDEADRSADVLTAGDKADRSADVLTAGDKADGDHGSEIVNGDGPGGHADKQG
ncbi:MAG TPA: hypothetical protein VGI50_03540 [Solirubrobacteraceae bacterium]|jgi:hypothetical protein